jgi:type II secretory pathway pseudopilin PulG
LGFGQCGTSQGLKVGAQLPRHAPSTHRFDFAVTLTVIGILATLLLNYLNKAQNDIEKVIVETQLNSLRLSLAEHWVDKSLKNQSINSETLINSNPMLLLAERPDNYIGEFYKAPSNKKAVWYFDTAKKQLIYVFNDGHQARYGLSSTAGQAKASLLSVGGLDLVKVVTEVN